LKSDVSVSIGLGSPIPFAQVRAGHQLQPCPRAEAEEVGLQTGFTVVVFLAGLRVETADVKVLHRFQVADVEGGVGELHLVSFAKNELLRGAGAGAAPRAIVMRLRTL